MLKDWQPGDFIVLVLAFLGWGATFWKGYNSLINKLNRQGEKYNELEPRVAANEARYDSIKDELNQERLAVMTLMFNNEKAANERHTELKVQIATLTERLNVRAMVSEVMHELRENK
jgi:hypothetical protein